MKKLNLLFITLFAGFSVATLAATPVSAVDVFDECENIPDSAVCQSAGEDGDDLPSMAEIVVNTLLLVLGMVAVIMIIVGGFRYTLSRGEASEVKVAKDIILYAIIGLIVAIMAYAIVNFVLDWF